MEGRSSYGSCSDYFERLRRRGCEIDDGIERLAETWRTPHLLIGGYAERTPEVDAYLKGLRESIRSTNNAVETFRSELKPSLDETDQFLEEAQSVYEDLKAKCDNIDIVLAEYGYQYEEDNNVQASKKNDSKDQSNSILTPKEISDVEIEFTPNLTWKCKAKSKELNVSISDQKNPIIKGIATPVIKSLASVRVSKVSNN